MRMFQVVRKRSFGGVAAALAFAFLAASCSIGCGHCPSTPIPGPRPLPSPVQFGAATVNNGGPIFVPTWSGADMSGTITSDAYRCGAWLSTSVQVEWPATGTPVGTFSYEASANSSSGVDGTFRPVTLTVDVQPTGGAGGDLVDFQSMPWVFLRVKYVPSSGGTGALPVVTFFGKGTAN